MQSVQEYQEDSKEAGQDIEVVYTLTIAVFQCRAVVPQSAWWHSRCSLASLTHPSP
jgi:hypothetical protein